MANDGATDERSDGETDFKAEFEPVAFAVGSEFEFSDDFVRGRL